jgi:hypothetical protein
VELSQGVRFGLLGLTVSFAAGLRGEMGAQAHEHTSAEETGREAGRAGREGGRDAGGGGGVGRHGCSEGVQRPAVASRKP